jgi:hypothetical protein
LCRPLAALRQPCQRAQRRSLVVRASKEAQLKEMEEFKQQVAKQLEAVTQAPSGGEEPDRHPRP